MSAHENDSLDSRIFAIRRSGLIDFEETNRMERPSRVFGSRHHVSMPPVLTGANNMDQNDSSYRRGDYTYVDINSYARNAGSLSTGDNQRNRSPFVRFTITDPETQRITATGQIPLSTPPSSSHANAPSTSAEAAGVPINEESDDDYSEFRVEYSEQRRLTNQINAMMNEVNEHQLRHTRTGLRRLFTQHPYLIRNNFDTTASNNRIRNRRVRVHTTTHRLINHSLDRSQTPEQELPEVFEDLMEPENEEYEEVYHGQESPLSSVVSQNDADFDDGMDDNDDGVDDNDDGVDNNDDANGDDDRRSANLSVSENPDLNVDEENGETLDLSNETPITRAVPFILSPTSSSPGFEPFGPETPLHMNNSVDNDANILRRDPISSSPNPLRSVVRPDTQNNGQVARLIDQYFNNAENITNGTNSSNVNPNEVDLFNNVVNLNRLPVPQINNRGSLDAVEDPHVETPPVRVEEHPETYDDLNEQLTRLFECPVCFEHIVPPVYQCFLGHLICNKCVVMCDNCPTCRNPFYSKRNLYMEKVGYLVKFPCRNTLTGCKQQLFITQKQIHEQECCYRHYQCFFNHCAWKGYYPELRAHMTSNHQNFILNGSDQIIEILMANNTQSFKWFLVAHHEFFAVIAHAVMPSRRIKIQVNFIGPAVKAKQFKFKVILTEQGHGTANNSCQKLTYERLTLPYSEIYEMSNHSGLKKDILSLPGEIIEQFMKLKRRRLPITLKVEPAGL